MCRKLFTLAAGASAVLCVGVCALWVWSYFRLDQVVRTSAESRPVAADNRYLIWFRRLTATSTRGKVLLELEHLESDTDARSREGWWASHLPTAGWDWSSSDEQPSAEALSAPDGPHSARASLKVIGWHWMWLSIER
jgi:hypothetical protein